MSEEKPVFKVTDRRLFKPDGTPRDDVERVERSADTPSTAAPNAASEITTASNSSKASAASPATASSTDSATASSRIAVDNAAPPPQSAASSNVNQQAAQTSSTEDPTAFVNLLMFIASPAAAALGLTEHPGIGAEEIDLPLAKHCIDLLATLRQKTQGSLTAQESQILENLLTELRMQFVSLSSGRSASPAMPRGFSGSDITGGK